MKFWPHIEFIDDKEGCLFTARVFRQMAGKDVAEKTILAVEDREIRKNGGKDWRESSDLAEKIIAVVSKNPQVTTQEISDILEISLRSVERGIAALKTSGKLRRVGGRKAGYWQLTKG